MATTVYSSYEGTPALGSNIFVKVRNPITTALLQARTNTGIRESDAGRYVWSGSLADLDAYDVIWDENNSVFRGEIFIPRPSVTVNTTTGTPLPLVGDPNGTLAGLSFLIKRGDTLPYLRRQLVDTNNAIVTLDPSDTVMFTMRTSSDVTMAGSPKVHAAANIIDAANGIVEFRWRTGDTDTSTYSETSTLGRPVDTPYAGEFEVTRFADGAVETYPQNTYIAISIPPDLDPGINP